MTGERPASVPVERRSSRAAPQALAGVMLAALFMSACGSGSAPRTPASPLPSGQLDVVTPRAASAAVLGLCEVRADLPAVPSAAASTFEDRAHEELHVIAAATQVRDRAAAASLLETMQRLEAGFADASAATDLAGDVDALLAATRDALSAIGLGAPACPA